MRAAVKGEISGHEGSNDRCFLALIEEFEERQRRWHLVPPAIDCPPTYRRLCHSSDRLPTCLLIVEEARNLISYMNL